MSAAQIFYSFGKLGEPFADMRKGSLFNGYYFHASNLKWFIKRVDSIFIGKWKKNQEPFSKLSESGIKRLFMAKWHMNNLLVIILLRHNYQNESELINGDKLNR